MDAADYVGWTASVILFATVSRQVWKQWTEQKVEGVSQWLFIGQIAASAGFLIYSVLLGQTVFIVTNAFMLVAAVIGEVIYLRAGARQSRQT